MLKNILLIGLGGFFGSIARYYVSKLKNHVEWFSIPIGIMGYGSSSKISSSKFWELTEKLPVVIELFDQTARLEAFYEEIREELLSMPKGCLVSLEPVNILLQKKGK